MRFDNNGARTDFKLRLVELTREGLKHVRRTNVNGIFLLFLLIVNCAALQVGDWTPAKRVTFMSNYTKAMTEIYRDTLKNKTLTVVTIKVGQQSIS